MRLDTEVVSAEIRQRASSGMLFSCCNAAATNSGRPEGVSGLISIAGGVVAIV